MSVTPSVKTREREMELSLHMYLHGYGCVHLYLYLVTLTKRKEEGRLQFYGIIFREGATLEPTIRSWEQ